MADILQLRLRPNPLYIKSPMVGVYTTSDPPPPKISKTGGVGVGRGVRQQVLFTFYNFTKLWLNWMEVLKLHNVAIDFVAKLK